MKEYKNYLIPYLDGNKHHAWMIASTLDDNINVLTLAKYRKAESLMI